MMMNRLLPAIRRSRPQGHGLTTSRSDLGVLICCPLRGVFQVRIMTAAIHTQRQVLVAAAAAAAFVLLSSLAAAQDLVQQLQQQGGRTLSSASGSRVKQMAKYMPKLSETSCLHNLRTPEGRSIERLPNCVLQDCKPCHAMLYGAIMNASA